MKRILLLLVFTMVFTLSGCKTKGYDDPEDLVQAFIDFLTDSEEGIDVDGEKECELIAKGDYYDQCVQLIDQYDSLQDEDWGVYSWSITIIDSQLRELNELELLEYGFDNYDKVYEFIFDFTEEFIRDEGDTVETDEGSEVVYLIKEDGMYYIVQIGSN